MAILGRLWQSDKRSCGSDYVRLKLLAEREELTLVRTLELA